MSGLISRPCTLAQANEMVALLHRHHKPVQGHRFSIAAYIGTELVGAAIVGRPQARMVHQYHVAEVLRLVTNGHKDACSFLYARCARAAEAMGFLAIQTYTLISESGSSLRAVALEDEGQVLRDGNGWGSRIGRRETAVPEEPRRRWRRYFDLGYREVEKQKLQVLGK